MFASHSYKSFYNVKLLLATLLILIAAGLVVNDAAAQQYPSKPIRLIVPFSPGGGTDILARSLAIRMIESMGQRIIVDNRPGAGGLIATSIVAKVPPDGYTLLQSTNAFTITPSLYQKVPFNAERDFTPITIVAATQCLLAVNPSVPVQNVEQLITLARAKPGALTISAAGVGTPSHMSGELFKQMAGVDILTVQYKGTGASLSDLMGGHVTMTFAAMPALVPLVQSGKLRALGVSGLKRSSTLPDVPTIAEALPGFEMAMWYAMFVRAGTSREIVLRIYAEIVKALDHPDMKKYLASRGFEPGGIPPDEFAKLVKSELKRWEKVIQAGKLQISSP